MTNMYLRMSPFVLRPLLKERKRGSVIEDDTIINEKEIGKVFADIITSVGQLNKEGFIINNLTPDNTFVDPITHTSKLFLDTQSLSSDNELVIDIFTPCDELKYVPPETLERMQYSYSRDEDGEENVKA